MVEDLSPGKMADGSSQIKLRCPYCGNLFSSHASLRRHVGSNHNDKVDEFAEVYSGGRWIELDFVSYLLQNSISKLTTDYLDEFGGRLNCPIALIYSGFHPSNVSLKVSEGETKEVLKSDVIWTCTSCLACHNEDYEMNPYEVINTLRNLSARIGYHYPKGYKTHNRNIQSLGKFQRVKKIRTREGVVLSREDLGLPEALTPKDLGKFREALKILTDMRVEL
jgi:hypothetical protein